MTKIIAIFNGTQFGGREHQAIEELRHLVPGIIFEIGLLPFFQESNAPAPAKKFNTVADVFHKACAVRGVPVSLNCHWYDVGNTVWGATRSVLSRFGELESVTVSACMDKDSGWIREAPTKVIAATLISSIEDGYLSTFEETPGHDVRRLVPRLLRAGVRGIICSPYEARTLRKEQVPLEITVHAHLDLPDGPERKLASTQEIAELQPDYVRVDFLRHPEPLKAAREFLKELHPVQ